MDCKMRNDSLFLRTPFIAELTFSLIGVLLFIALAPIVVNAIPTTEYVEQQTGAKVLGDLALSDLSAPFSYQGFLEKHSHAIILLQLQMTPGLLDLYVKQDTLNRQKLSMLEDCENQYRNKIICQ